MNPAFKAAVARRIVAYLRHRDVSGLGPDADAEVAAMVREGRLADGRGGVTGEPEELWLALWLALCRCEAGRYSRDRLGHQRTARTLVEVLRRGRPELVPAGAEDVISGHGPLPEDHRPWAALAGALLDHGRPADLPAAVDAVDRYRRGSPAYGGVDPQSAVVLGELLMERLLEADLTAGPRPADRGGDDPQAAWSAAADILYAGVQALPSRSEERAAANVALGVALSALAGVPMQGAAEYSPLDPTEAGFLERALRTLWEAVTFLPEDGRSCQARALLAQLLLHRFLNGNPRRDPADLDKAIREQTRAVALSDGRPAAPAAPAASPEPALRIDLAHLLGRRAQLHDRREDFDAAVAHAEQAVADTRAGQAVDGLHAFALSCRGLARLDRFDRYGGRQDLDAAVTDLRACAGPDRGAPAPAAADRAGALGNLAEALLVRRTVDGRPDRDDLAEALACAAAAVELAPSSPDDFGRLCVLSSAQLTTYQETGDTDQLQGAVLTAALAVRAVPPDHPAAAECGSRLAAALAERARLRGPGAGDRDFADAVDQARRAVALGGGEDQALRRHNLGTLLADRLQTVPSEQDAQDLIALHREIVRLTPEDSRLRPGRFHSLQVALRLAARVLDEPDLHADAVDAARAACRTTVDDPAFDDPTARPALLAGLAAALRDRADAVLTAIDADPATPPGPPTAAARQAEAGPAGGSGGTDGAATSPDPAALRQSALDGLTEAVETATEAHALTPPDARPDSFALRELVRALLARADAAPEHSRGDLDRALGLAAGALRDGRPARSHRYELLLLAAEAELGLHRADAAAASAAAAAAGAAAAGAAAAAAAAAVTRAEDDGEDGGGTTAPADASGWQHADRALAHLAEVADADPAPLPSRLVAAEAGARFAAGLGDTGRAHRDYRLAVDLLRRCAAVGLDVAGVRGLLRRWSALGPDAAAAALADGDPAGALELLESARAVLWRQLLDLRGDLDAVDAVDPALADRLRRAASVLRAGSLAAHPAAGPVADERRAGRGLRLLDPGADRFQDAARRWEEAVAEARALVPGFLAGPAAADLCAGVPGPVVVVNVSRHRCDALLVERTGVRVVPLAGLTAAEVEARAEVHQAAVRRFEERAAERAGAPGVGVTGPFNRVLAELAEWLWDRVAVPVLDVLAVAAPDGAGHLPRLWWCPTGLLSLLPLHAAGYHAPPGTSLVDRVVPSYTPTVAALAAAATRPDVTGPPRVLGVLADRVPGTAALPGADIQHRLITDRFPDATVLADGRADSRRVLSALPDHTVLHVMCHGHHDPARPQRSGLVLEDGVVPIAVLAAERTDGVLVSLTACRTATVDARTPDELISIAAAMTFAGWRQAVATLWPVDAAETTAVAGEVYAPASGGHPAAAGPPPFDPADTARHLHRAVLARRSPPAAPRARLWAWAPYVHVGV
ncbi:CHAT domain-containing protein [Kitasatospora sp. NPDC048540]|uniref:CHAT domain-containing protein n=1 Tax=Kitasatospora sp. NPDC048540 TaxID=3155634 RepID=UPI003409B2C5